jgi:cation diffusion facilitator family transporter
MAKSNISIYSALAANLVIAVTKFIAGIFSNSSAMIAEGVHSLADTINQLLILFGIRQSKKPPDATRPFGYGKELYFWSFIVSIIIFGLGGGVSVYQGYLHIIKPEMPGDLTWNYVVLGISFLFEGSSLLIAANAFNKTRKGQSWWPAIKRSKDPSAFLVLFEDGAAVLGLTVVAICLYTGHRFHLPWLDGLASLLVGVLLVGVSFILARESRSLLMGEGLAPATRQRISTLVQQDRAVKKIKHILSTYQSPEEVLLILIIIFKEGLDTTEINDAVLRIRATVKREFSFVHFILIQPEALEK